MLIDEFGIDARIGFVTGFVVGDKGIEEVGMMKHHSCISREGLIDGINLV